MGKRSSAAFLGGLWNLRSAWGRAAAVAALLAAVAACDLGSPPKPVHRQAQADPTAVPAAPSATATAPPAPSTPATPAAVPPATPAAAPPATPATPVTVPPAAAPQPPPGFPLPLVPAARRPAATAPPPPPPPESPPPPHEVAATSADELRRKRAEWEELQRMQEQARSRVEAWQRARQSADEPPMPHVGDAPESASQAEAAQMQSDMRAWYRRYSHRSAAVTLALSQYGTAASAEPRDTSRLRDACGKLLAASTALLDDPRALPAPLRSASAALSTAYAEIKATAQACLAYRDDDRAAHLAAALRAMAAAGTALRPYSMTP
jgi:hypothetical protein